MLILVHSITIIIFFSFSIACFSQFKNYKRLGSVFSTLSVLGQIVVLLVTLNAQAGGNFSELTFSLGSAWGLMFCSMLMLLCSQLSREGSILRTNLFCYFSFFLFLLSLIGFHEMKAVPTYSTSASLLFHILVSIFGQVTVYFVFCLNLLVCIIQKSLKAKMYYQERLPALVPTTVLFYNSELVALLFLSLSMLSGLLIRGQDLGTFWLKFVFTLTFLVQILIMKLVRKKGLISGYKTNKVSLFIWIFLIFAQAMYKIGVI